MKRIHSFSPPGSLLRFMLSHCWLLLFSNKFNLHSSVKGAYFHNIVGEKHIIQIRGHGELLSSSLSLAMGNGPLTIVTGTFFA